MNFTPAITQAPIPRPSTHRLVRMAESPCAESVALIQRIVAETFGVPVWTMTAKQRPQHIAEPRMVAMFLAREVTDMTLVRIGEAFGGRDHGTVLHACRAVKNWMSVEPALAALIEQLKERCRRGQ